MNNLSQKFQETESELPSRLHGNIMAGVKLLKYRRLILLALPVLTVMLFGFAWQTWMQLLEIQAGSLLSTLITGFEMDYTSIADLAANFAEFLPLHIIAVTFINLLLLAESAYLALRLGKMSNQRVEAFT